MGTTLARILVIDDDQQSRGDVVDALRKKGYAISEASSINEGRDQVTNNEFDLIISDLWLPEEPARGAGTAGRELGGWLLLLEARDRYPHVRLIIYSAKSKPEELQLLARDLNIPFISVEGTWVRQLLDLTDRLLDQRRIELTHSSVYSDSQIEAQLDLLISYEKSADAATKSVPVLFFGETGTGKGYWAEQLFRKRRDAALSKYYKNINCAALGEGNALLVGLFGALPGVFYGTEEVPGLFELMDENWTIFLDEISKIDKIAQGALLKLVDERTAQRYPFIDIFKLPPQNKIGTGKPGSRKAIAKTQTLESAKNDYERLAELVKERFPTAKRYHSGWAFNEPYSFYGRIIAAAHVHLVDLVRKELFLPDLYNRLMCFSIKIPSLREMGSAYIEKITQEFLTKRGATIDRGGLALIRKHEWRAGNRRELIMTLESAIIRSGSQKKVSAENLYFVDAPF